MFPDRVGRLALDGTEYVRDQRLLGGFGWAALDNITASFHDGFWASVLMPVLIIARSPSLFLAKARFQLDKT